MMKEETDQKLSDLKALEKEDVRILIKRCQDGDNLAYKKLFEMYQQRTYVVSYNILGDADLSRDVVQDAFIRVFKNIRKFDASKSFYTWLYQIVVNLSIDYLRKRASMRSTSMETIGETLTQGRRKNPDAMSDKKELKEEVHKTLSRLPPKYRIALALKDIEGLSCEEIAELVHCNSTTVRWRIYQARRIFKSMWHGEPLDLNDSFNEGLTHEV